MPFSTAMKACTVAYDVAALTISSVRHMGYAIRRERLLLRQFYEVGNRSLLIVSLLGAFMGMILALQTGYQLRRFGYESEIGLIGVAVLREFGPVLTAFLLAGRIGSSYAAEIGTMKVYEEIDALTVMGVRPVAYLASPRVLACLVLLPMLVIYADFIAMLGGAFVSRTYLGIPFSSFFRVFFEFVRMKDIWRPMVKCVVFGMIISVVGCYFGFRTTGGAEGVGRSTTDSVVYSILSVLIADYFLEKILLAF